MNDRPNDGELELRALLDSIGMESPRAPSPAQAAIDRARAERDLAQITATAPAPPTAAPRSWWVRVGAAAAAVVVLAVAAVVTIMVVPSSSPPAAAALTPPMLSYSGIEVSAVGQLTGTSAAQVLAGLAQAAEAQPAPDPSLPVQRIEQYGWWSTTELSTTPSPGPDGSISRAKASVMVPVQRTSYLLPDGTMRTLEQNGSPLDQDGRPSDTPSSWGVTASASDNTFSTGQPADYPETLPADPARLLAELAPTKDCAKTQGDCLFQQLTSIYSSYVVSPQRTAEMWRAAALAPGITTLGTTTDRLGRAAVALAAPAEPAGEEIVVLADPTTGAVLGSETILTKHDPAYAFTPPAVISFTAIVAADRVAASGP
jgi:hypothetical protein